MSGFTSCLYAGKVVHRRVRPKAHRLGYRVFSMCLDVDEIDRLDLGLPIFSRNRFNLFGFHDRDYGPGDGTRVDVHTRRLLAEAGLSHAACRIRLLCYPRILGYVFNPLSVYFCEDRDGFLAAIVYEVSNTFGERKSYVIPVEAGAGPVLHQSCAKEMYVSPFTHRDGRYSFSIRPPGEDVVVGVAFHDGDGAVMNAHFSGARLPLDLRTLWGVFARFPLMTVKVIGGIHLEAARLWSKGVPLVARHGSPAYSFTVVGRAPAQK
jgi:DUF1365 family protein